jgi:hypothetical protein
VGLLDDVVSEDVDCWMWTLSAADVETECYPSVGCSAWCLSSSENDVNIYIPTMTMSETIPCLNGHGLPGKNDVP